MPPAELEAGESPRPGAVRFLLTIAYDGKAYAGWQVQKTGVGVQEKVEQAVQRLIPGAGRLHSSSRTDTGVHAIGLCAHVDFPKAELKMSASKLRLAINAWLPGDIRVVGATRCSLKFHARFSARGKQYRYFVWNHPAMNPLLRFVAWHVPQRLDAQRMRRAARLFLGKHDFRSFAANRSYKVKHTERTLSKLNIRRAGPLFTFVIEGDGFLYKMCRGIVGTLIQAGRGKFSSRQIPDMLKAKNRGAAGMTAPACGLVLWRVNY